MLPAEDKAVFKDSSKRNWVTYKEALRDMDTSASREDVTSESSQTLGNTGVINEGTIDLINHSLSGSFFQPSRGGIDMIALSAKNAMM